MIVQQIAASRDKRGAATAATAAVAVAPAVIVTSVKVFCLLLRFLKRLEGLKR